jgi:hypothetical protein
MEEKVRILHARGRQWTIRKVRVADGEEADFDSWYDGLTPEQRVEAVGDALLRSLKARGMEDRRHLPSTAITRRSTILELAAPICLRRDTGP